MSKASTKPPSGMRDFLALDLLRRKYVISIVERVYRAHGFTPLETPAIENLSTLLGKYGEEGDQLLYRVLKRRDALTRVTEAAAEAGEPAAESELANQGLRYDLTVPFARVVAQYGDLPRFYRRYQIQPVWRADRPGRGRFREFYQCDVDITGTDSPLADAEVCSAVCTALRTLGFEDFEVRLNHRELLRAMIRAAGIDAGDEATALVAVDKLDKIGEEGVLGELAERGVTAEAAKKLLSMMVVSESSTDTEILDGLAGAVDEAGARAVESLRELLQLTASTPAGPHMRVMPALARGLSYYTGPIFEIAVPELAGSMGGGGRYDDLVGLFGKREVPCVGFALGLERILVVMDERNMYPPELRGGPELMLCWMDVPLPRVMEVATGLRKSGIAVEVYPEAAKLKKQLQYAASPGVDARWVGILGKDELNESRLTLKNLGSGEQVTVSIDAVAQTVRGSTGS